MIQDSVERTEKNQTEEAMQEQQEEGILDKESLERAVAVLAASSDIGWACENGIWFYRDENGQLCKGWKYIAEKWYYFDPTYSYMYADGWRNVREEGKKYYFTENGDAYTGWLYDSQYDIWYCFKEGQYRNGWLQDEGNWYYFIHGRMLYDGWYQTGENEYSEFNKSGVWLGSSTTPGQAE